MNIVKLSDVAHRANTKEDRFNTDKIYYVGGEHIESEELIVHDKGIIKGSTIGPMFTYGFKAGDILFVTRNPHLRKCSVVEFDGICSEKTLVIETLDNNILLQDYLAIVMQSDDFWDYMEENKSGGVNYFINWSTLADYQFSLPPLSEQKILAEKLWAAYRLKEAYKKLLVATDEMVKAKFVEMFGNGQYPSKTLEEISEDWLKGQPLKKDDLTNDGKSPCIHYGELFTKYNPIITNVISKTNVEKKKTSQKGDILFPASDVTPNGLARCSMINGTDVILGGDIIVLRPQKEYNPSFLSYAINQQKQQLLTRVYGAVIKHISIRELKTVTIPIPPKNKQDEYVNIANQAEKSKTSLLKSIESIDSVIKSLINNQE